MIFFGLYKLGSEISGLISNFSKIGSRFRLIYNIYSLGILYFCSDKMILWKIIVSLYVAKD